MESVEENDDDSDFYESDKIYRIEEKKDNQTN